MGYYESEPLTQLDLGLGDVFELSIPPPIASRTSIYGTSCYPNLDPYNGLPHGLGPGCVKTLEDIVSTQQ